MNTNVLNLQRLPEIASLDLSPFGIFDEDPGCKLCTHTCCCTAED